MSIEQRLELRCHPSRRPAEVRAIQVTVHRSAGAELRLGFLLEGDIPRIKLPAPAAPRVGIELWRHTCFEAFIALAGQPAYHEFNLAPSGEWAVYAMRGYRDGAPLADQTMRPQIAVHSTATRLELDATIALASLSALHARSSLRAGLCAVIETGDGLSYWALSHPAGKPDFHNSDGFTLLLEPPGPES